MSGRACWLSDHSFKLPRQMTHLFTGRVSQGIRATQKNMTLRGFTLLFRVTCVCACQAELKAGVLAGLLAGPSHDLLAFSVAAGPCSVAVPLSQVLPVPFYPACTPL